MSCSRPSRRPGSRALPLSCVVAGALTAGCASRPASVASPGPIASATPSCLVVADSVGPPRPVIVALADSADAERTRRAESLDTPVRLDCMGRALPGLATAWSPDSSGRFWTLQLDSLAGGPDEPRLTASSLAAAWRAGSAASDALRFAGIVSLFPLDAHRLVVGFSAPRSALPGVFADPALGLPRARPGPTTLTVRGPGSDLRDALDGDADLVVSDDPALLEYAGRRPGFTSVPLPWSRSYVLLLPGGSSLEAAVPADDTAGFRSGLARDAVRADARPVVGPSWWDEPGDCRPAPAPGVAAQSSTIVYPEDDVTARELSERLVALARSASLQAHGLGADSLSAALRAGNERGYVVPLPSHALVPCRAVADWPAGAAAVGLVQTRAHAIIRRGTPALVVGWDGTLRSPDGAGLQPRSP